MDTKSRKLTNLTAVDSQNQVEPISQEIHRQIVMDVLSIHANIPDINPHIQTVTVFDCQHDRYQLLQIGWTDSHKRIFTPILHLDIIEGKVWIQENRTDIDIGEELSSRGIPKSDIVLGLHPPHLRPYNSEYSIT
ncbi:XisI protein [Scytonema sp. UIC 10036]|uniref:XisI protein n=1 Tax=Scytonema sp. UIC 10036 TaxID=2304196 RepID=UPI0012DAA41D|nr:XisI protein [Scytonema sp. UIC 10036]MUG92344.1 XisI protein [Scytonema sp. UIC 10036]